MDIWSAATWGSDDNEPSPPGVCKVDLSNVVEYLRDIGHAIPARMELDFSGTRWRARIVQADGSGNVLLDRPCNRFMTASGETPQSAMVSLDLLAGAKHRE